MTYTKRDPKGSHLFQKDSDKSLWFALVVNIFLTILGATAGFLLGSLSLLSATVDNLLDSVSSVIGIGASQLGRKLPSTLDYIVPSKS